MKWFTFPTIASHEIPGAVQQIHLYIHYRSNKNSQ